MSVCRRCGLPFSEYTPGFGAGDDLLHQSYDICFKLLLAKVQELSGVYPPRISTRSSTDPTGVELVNRFNAMTEALRIFSDASNWIIQESHRGDAYKGSVFHVSTLWAPDVRFQDRMGDPWLIAQKALGMVESKA